MNIEKLFAKRNAGVEWSGIRIMFAMADKIEGVTNLGIGQPDFDTPVHIRDAAKKGLDQGYTRYPPAAGFQDLREAVARKVEAENKLQADPDSEIFISVGAMQGIFNVMLHLVNPGDEVIVVDPGYDYYSQIRLFGGVPVRVAVKEENRFKLDPKDVKKAVTLKTKAIILNTPSNPTGAVFDRESLEQIAAICKEHEIMVISDEPYEHILFDGNEHVSIGSLDGMKDLTVSIYTLSKSYAMTGWRVGYVVADKAIIDEMEKLMEHMVSGVTAVAQRAALAAITESQDCVKQMVERYAKRRELMYNGLNSIKGISCVKPESTFYAFPNISSFGMSSWDFAKYMVKEHKLALLPGSIFGENGEGFARLSFATSSRNIETALKKLQKGIAGI
ncbi:MAG: pyridoxal phosphate-dependent aminotransferase [Desulfobacula sp.]|jgi:aspartate/methionine/tyrosine aminotransferase|uniref:pyridoxal phosphate-dependent aminotransferase n=1 Tax=Desulfobacula sp. TaxID=2593537 RepID=UPI001D383562|nr:pyridoxal phosphate-dependent aminotransferase [Desulfobacula sp.]MBT3803549.1 pyridoxal phosphate-dependent aminotransferase [Desulfobacula sp.]MBT4023340.1 pyridoxal phosphate-dependent aminotransferase [Desulfobacula sp.]MBT4197325.1 pyridoxal phosphate-dependent aminotransferase [Desulfobacula sp.]MBT4505005.1 pyridoxal phosphate-dependent aminotransferase [Desulfobacula sp.]